MFNLLRAEALKSKRTFARKLAYGAPLFFVVYALVVKMLMPVQQLASWDLLLYMVFNWWPVLFIPLGTALMCALTEAREKKSGADRSLRARPVSLIGLWLSKIAVTGWLTFLSSCVLMVSTLAAGLLIADGQPPVLDIILGGLTVWLVSLPLIPLQLMAAAWKGSMVSILLGLFGLFAGVLSAANSYWVAVPWSWPTRLMAPMFGVHPNGVPLVEGDPLLSPSVIPVGIAASIVFLAVTSLLTAVWYARREVR
ncbi:lantibiotic immunity ABC transporter MutE/EpiE family permease subunit [Paenibacillus sp. CN-4]|uniref:lantibiotic immunity ABC transporter MutE/EpiE family permease subunit n=1 Tax=Paenibacillus nanchangensis TaxID=3348343 RepID=UPI0039794C7F